jgi:hypothetical protein
VLGREVTRVARHFASKVITTPDVQRAEAEIQPITEEEAKSSSVRGLPRKWSVET